MTSSDERFDKIAAKLRAQEINRAFDNATYPRWPEPRSRAVTDNQKADMLDGIMAVWRENPKMRLGQLIRNAMRMAYTKVDDADFATRLFQIEDADLLEALDAFAESQRAGRAKYEAQARAIEALADDGMAPRGVG